MGGTVPTEPIYIGGQAVHCKFYTLARNPGDPSRIEGTFTLVGGEGVLTLDALVGPQGIPGQPSPIIRPQWGSPITDPEDLPDTATLDASDDGRAWYIDGQWHIYADMDGDFHVVQGSIPGPPGVTPDISVSAEGVPATSPVTYGSIDVQESGTTAAPNFHIKIPLIPGPEGPASSIELASDYDDSISAHDGDFLRYDEESEKWGPASPSIVYPKMWTIPEGNWIESTSSSGRTLIASLNLPALPFEWYPDVIGHLRIRKTLLSSAQLEIEVRIGDTGVGTGDTAPLCGLSPYDPTFNLFDSIAIAQIGPHFSNESDPMRSVSPDTSVARVLDGQAKTIYVYVHKVGGAGSYEFTKDRAQLRINVMPVK
ncbi:hypothetical protein EB72_24840 [Mycobacterium sp. SWH-M1]|nr:hypothetical protein EB72_24840 [Mycobacterium sp. SWH-M1]